MGVGGGQLSLDEWLQVGEMKRYGRCQMRQDVLARWRQAPREQGVGPLEVRWQRFGEGFRADKLRARALVL